MTVSFRYDWIDAIDCVMQSKGWCIVAKSNGQSGSPVIIAPTRGDLQEAMTRLYRGLTTGEFVGMDGKPLMLSNGSPYVPSQVFKGTLASEVENVEVVDKRLQINGQNVTAIAIDFDMSFDRDNPSPTGGLGMIGWIHSTSNQSADNSAINEASQLIFAELKISRVWTANQTTYIRTSTALQRLFESSGSGKNVDPDYVKPARSGRKQKARATVGSAPKSLIVLLKNAIRV